MGFFMLVVIFRSIGAFDMYGAIWVVGDINTGSGNITIFFDENLELPTLNVILIRQLWEEIIPSSVLWV